MLPKVSIIIPTYNEGNFLEKTLRTLKNVDYPKDRTEIIVADYNSRDDTRSIARKYADKLVIVKRHGISAGRNDGAKAAKGDILIFIDADTIAIPNTIKELVSKFSIRRIVGATPFIMPDNTKVNDLFLFIMYNSFIHASMRTKKACMTGACIACRRSYFHKIGGFNERLSTLEDFDFAERLSKLGKLAFAEKTFVVVSTRRLTKWGRFTALRNYMRLYFNHLAKRQLFKGISYYPIRKLVNFSRRSSKFKF